MCFNKQQLNHICNWPRQIFHIEFLFAKMSREKSGQSENIRESRIFNISEFIAWHTKTMAVNRVNDIYCFIWIAAGNCGCQKKITFELIAAASSSIVTFAVRKWTERLNEHEQFESGPQIENEIYRFCCCLLWHACSKMCFVLFCTIRWVILILRFSLQCSFSFQTLFMFECVI